VRFARFIGIDPGKDGAIAYLDDEGELVDIVKMPVISGVKSKTKKEYDISAMVKLITEPGYATNLASGKTLVTLEQLQTMPPGMGGGQANFQRGFAYGTWLGILAALKQPFLTVRPQKWQGALLTGTPKDTKQGSIMVAQRTWPHFDFRRSDRAKKPDDGKTDAALIGLYGQMINKDGRLLEHIRS
jgi:hypothetical protein